MNLLFVDASAGAGGDMLLRAMLGLGLPASRVQESLRRLGPGAPPVAGELVRWIRGSRLQSSLKEPLLRVWRLLARAEGESHGCPWDKVRFHQLSRPETMKNIVGFCAGLSHFRIRRVYTGPVPVGRLWRDHSGRIRKEPGPTASRLLRRARLAVQLRPEPFEWTTPTGAALLAAFAAPNPPPLRVLKIGHGSGRLPAPGGPKPLRLLLAEALS